ncbi:hypothetical protein ONS95_002813 [Cadophora gregata]|uniref:uncharacterized protein n=1 Tax=Cadophora gregata TaxID=51156 RepID=UPI0026DB34D4|nr:uncharacterized protein ONS95_002813 [Cadophora gregata]KAK0110161.1 hypothetical protein ONS95_002813 [Cadophora gregata]KAK0110223.1 hypothetical protein ONS96_001846 [Cadophora gregata f. sp. sojae]
MLHRSDVRGDVGFDGNGNEAHYYRKRRRLNPRIPSPELLTIQHTSTTYRSISVHGSADTPHSCNDPISGDRSSLLPDWHGLETAAGTQAATGLDQAALILQEECCYGMLPSIRVRLSAGPLDSSKYLPVSLEASNIIRLQDSSRHETFQIESPLHLSALDQLVAIKDISMQSYCSADTSISTIQEPHKRKRRVRHKQSWTLRVILYGPPDLEDIIGQFLSGQKIYLQDPVHCDRCVPYRNPHVIQPATGEVLRTNMFEPHAANLEIERLEASSDLLSQLMGNAVQLPETEPSDIVKTTLFSHQKQALTFMLRREKGWQVNLLGDIWTSHTDTFGRTKYRNNVNETFQVDRPPSFQGGLLADDMGLGKTLSMIAVIASNQVTKVLPSPPMTLDPFQGPAVKTSILIVPLALIQSWEEQFKVHVKSGTLKIHVFHGQNRRSVDCLKSFDVAITTYHTISSIWRKWKDNADASESIFSIMWHRVVLDEAHIIQNSQKHLAQSCCALRSTNRWAITGTPIQNKLSDFSSIVAFLQVHPYSDQAIFDEEIAKPWRKDNFLGFLRLKTLVRAITIARTKDVVLLPPREDFIHHVDFMPEERQIYEDAKKQTVALLQDAASSSYENRTSVNALQRLNALRLICSHGLLTQSYLAAQSLSQITPCTGSQDVYADSLCTEDLETMFDGSDSCVQCGATTIADLVEYSQQNDGASLLGLGGDQPILCPGCRPRINRPVTVRESRYTDNLQVLDSPMTMSSSPSVASSPTSDIGQGSTLLSMPTKIKELLTDLTTRGADEKSVVFSYWTYTLDLIQIMLEDSKIPFVRFDGKMSQAKRTESLRTFKRDPSVRVILVSITCGGAGLDLTAASRAYLMEPHWNPMIEEQALCRVHRVGQKRSVTTIRYLMRDSFEEQVVEIQKRKKLLAKVAFGQDPLEESGIGMSTLQYLKSVLE